MAASVFHAFPATDRFVPRRRRAPKPSIAGPRESPEGRRTAPGPEAAPVMPVFPEEGRSHVVSRVARLWPWILAVLIVSISIPMVSSCATARVAGVGASLSPSSPPEQVLSASLVAAGGPTQESAADDGAHLEAAEAQLLKLLNDARARRELKPLQLDPRLISLARQRSADMARRGYFGHVTPEGTMVFDMMDLQGIPYRLAGENLARNSYPLEKSAEVAHNGFLNSPKHAENDYDPQFNKVGIGMAIGPTGSIFFTELFAVMD
jgi:uncharacterized protein YkwD